MDPSINTNISPFTNTSHNGVFKPIVEFLEGDDNSLVALANANKELYAAITHHKYGKRDYLFTYSLNTFSNQKFSNQKLNNDPFKKIFEYIRGDLDVSPEQEIEEEIKDFRNNCHLNMVTVLSLSQVSKRFHKIATEDTEFQIMKLAYRLENLRRHRNRMFYGGIESFINSFHLHLYDKGSYSDTTTLTSEINYLFNHCHVKIGEAARIANLCGWQCVTIDRIILKSAFGTTPLRFVSKLPNYPNPSIGKIRVTDYELTKEWKRIGMCKLLKSAESHANNGQHQQVVRQLNAPKNQMKLIDIINKIRVNKMLAPLDEDLAASELFQSFINGDCIAPSSRMRGNEFLPFAD